MFALREADGAQLGSEVLPLPGALSVSIELACSSEASGFRGVGRGVRSVVEHMRYCACLTGSTSGSDGCRRPCFGRIACSRMSCKRSGATCRHREFPLFPRAKCRDRCTRPIITGSLFLEDRQSALRAARRPQRDRIMNPWLRVGPLVARLLAHFSIVSGIGPQKDPLVAGRARGERAYVMGVWPINDRW